jgi:hypothetical protein
VGAGSVFYRDALDDRAEWVKIRPPFERGIVTGIESVGSDIFVSLTDGSRNGLYKLAASNNNESYDSSKNYSTEKQIGLLMSFNDTLFAAAGVGESELLWFDGNTLSSTGLTGHRIRAGEYDGENYWFVSSSHIFKAASAPGAWYTPTFDDNNRSTVIWNIETNTPQPDSVLDDKYSFTDIFYDPPDSIYLCSSDRYIMMSPDKGVTWQSGSSRRNYRFNSIAKINNTIIFGVNGYGLRKLSDPADLDSVLDQPGGNFTRLPSLYSSTIIRLFVDNDKLLAGTSNGGVWRGDYSSGVPYWAQE